MRERTTWPVYRAMQVDLAARVQADDVADERSSRRCSGWRRGPAVVGGQPRTENGGRQETSEHLPVRKQQVANQCPFGSGVVKRFLLSQLA